MKLKKLFVLAVLALCLSPWAAAAEEEPQIYVVKKGDTLWGISQRFITDPFYWPSLWANNPMVKNPHLIYPGQKLEIYDGRIELVPVAAEEPEAPEAQPLAEPEEAPKAEMIEEPQPQEAITVRVPMGGEGFIASEELDDAGILIDTVDNRIMIAAGETVFVEMKDLAAARPGDDYALFRVGREVVHPVTQEVVGRRVDELGEVRLDKVHEQVAAAVVTRNFQEIERGALLRPVLPRHREIELKKASSEISGYIIEGHRNKISLAQHDLLYVDIGKRQGLKEGNMLYISRPRKATLLALKEEVQLPEQLLGAAVVVDVRETTATALVLKSVKDIVRGDRVLTATQ